MSKILSAFLSLAIAISCVGGGRSADASYKVRVPYPMAAEGYPSHVHLSWNDNIGSSYDIYKADKSGRFVECAKVSGNEYMDFSIGKSENPRSLHIEYVLQGFLWTVRLLLK